MKSRRSSPISVSSSSSRRRKMPTTNSATNEKKSTPTPSTTSTGKTFLKWISQLSSCMSSSCMSASCINIQVNHEDEKKYTVDLSSRYSNQRRYRPHSPYRHLHRLRVGTGNYLHHNTNNDDDDDQLIPLSSDYTLTTASSSSSLTSLFSIEEIFAPVVVNTTPTRTNINITTTNNITDNNNNNDSTANTVSTSSKTMVKPVSEAAQCQAITAPSSVDDHVWKLEDINKGNTKNQLTNPVSPFEELPTRTPIIDPLSSSVYPFDEGDLLLAQQIKQQANATATAEGPGKGYGTTNHNNNGDRRNNRTYHLIQARQDDDHHGNGTTNNDNNLRESDPPPVVFNDNDNADINATAVTTKTLAAIRRQRREQRQQVSEAREAAALQLMKLGGREGAETTDQAELVIPTKTKTKKTTATVTAMTLSTSTMTDDIPHTISILRKACQRNISNEERDPSDDRVSNVNGSDINGDDEDDEDSELTLATALRQEERSLTPHPSFEEESDFSGRVFHHFYNAKLKVDEVDWPSDEDMTSQSPGSYYVWADGALQKRSFKTTVKEGSSKIVRSEPARKYRLV